ncbi:MAG: VCBS repeat-containing protein [Planctomycetota bacterium]
MLALLVPAFLAGAPQELLFPCPRISETEVRGSVDFDGDGFDDLFSAREVTFSDGAFGSALNISLSFAAIEVVSADINHDGSPDLVLADQIEDRLDVFLYQPLTSTFLKEVWSDIPINPDFLAAGDVDGDGLVDVLTARDNFNGEYAVVLGNGDGTTSSSVFGAVGTVIRGVQLGDLDGDGDADLVAPLEPLGMAVALADGTGGFGTPQTLFPAVAFGDLRLVDLNDDGALDIAAAGPATVRTLLGDGSGGFLPLATLSTVTSYITPNVDVVDLDGSGTLDVVVADRVISFVADIPLTIAYGDGAGGLTSVVGYALHDSHLAVAFGDFDGDGDSDLAYQNVGGLDGVVLQENRPGFGAVGLVGPEQIDDTFPRDFAFGDLDGDGDTDLVTLPEDPGTLQIGLNDGSGAFSLTPGPAVSIVEGLLFLADIAADGVLDALVLPDDDIPALLAIYEGDGAGGLQAEASQPIDGDGITAEFADWTSDGFVDLHLADPGGDELLRIYPGQASLTFGTPTTFAFPGSEKLIAAPGLPAAVDVNLDGDLDVVTTLDFLFSQTQVRVLEGDGTGGFTQIQNLIHGVFVPDGPDGITAGDFNDDGLPDIVLSDSSVYRGIGGGQLELVGEVLAGYDASEVRTADVNLDGVDDVIARTGEVFLGGAAGLTFDRAYGSSNTRDARVAEVTGDGAGDLFVTNDSGDFLLLRNEGCAGSFATFGAGCAGSTGIVPALEGAGCPSPGDVYSLEVEGGLPGAAAFATFGTGQGSLPLGNGCFLLLDPWIPVFVSFTLDASGTGSLPIAVAPGAAVGVTSTSQVGLFDPAAPGFFTVTNGLAVTVN